MQAEEGMRQTSERHCENKLPVQLEVKNVHALGVLKDSFLRRDSLEDVI